jgi:hypothetical protein
MTESLHTISFQVWEKTLLGELQKLWKTSDKFLPCHGPEHHIRVWQMAKTFGLKKHADMEVLLAACLFHDVYSFYEGEPKDHEKKSAIIARRILRKVGFPKLKIEKVTVAIMDHRSSVRGEQSLEGDILKSFDKLDAFGPIGVYRIITPLSIRKYGVYDILGWAFGEHRLDKKWSSIPFLEIRRKYRARFEYTKRYFHDLSKALGNVKNYRTSFSEKKTFSK